MYGKGVNFHISAFRNISKKTLLRTVEELDKAGIEIIWCSTKREDADRKLAKRFLHYIEELPCRRTTLIVISSDQDFRNEFQLAKTKGFDCIVMHDAKSPRWIQTLELYAKGYRWNDIMGVGAETSTMALPAIPQKQAKRKSKSSQEIMPQKLPTIARNPPSSHAAELQVLPIDQCRFWVEAECVQWKATSPYGFGTILRVIACGCGCTAAEVPTRPTCIIPPLLDLQKHRLYIHKRSLVIPAIDAGILLSDDECIVTVDGIAHLEKGEKVHALIFNEAPKGFRSMITRCIARIPLS
jgi:hypothetical protein